MTRLPGESALGTHRVANQPPPRGDIDLFGSDAALSGHLEGARETHRAALSAHGRALGTAEMAVACRDAHRHPPELAQFDRAGRRIDEVRFHPAHHRFMALSQGAGYAALPWEGTPGGHLARAATIYMASQAEPGHRCPMTMTCAAIPALAGAEGLEDWRAKLMSRRHDPAVAPLAEKAGATLGMALTERQGGSDVRTNETLAVRDGPAWRLTGHKWFCPAPMSDVFLALARAPRGLSCFLVPRWLEGARNGIRIQRLKDKRGNRSNASCEIEYDRAGLDGRRGGARVAGDHRDDPPHAA